MKRDDLIFDIIEKEHQRQLKGIELIASENFVSDQVMQAMGSCLTNKYAEGYPGKRYYGGCEVVDQSEQIAIDRLKEIFGAEWANVQPHSGAQANAAVFLAVLNPGDKFMGLNLAHGGHLSHGSLVNTSGIIYTPCEYNLNQETGRVDYDQMEEVALREKPKMIIGGGSAYSREWDYKRMREIADKVGAILMIDMAHPAGLIAAGLLENQMCIRDRYMTRVQRERFTDLMEYERVKNVYILRNKMLENTRPNLRILHPLPRVNEIAYDVDNNPKAYYFQQAQNGLYAREAILCDVLGITLEDVKNDILL